MKSLFLLSLLPFIILGHPKNLSYENNGLIYELKENDVYKIVGTNINTQSEYRLYGYFELDDNKYRVDEIDEDALNNITVDCKIMVSRDIDIIPSNAFDNEHIKYINFTGSLAEWSSLSINCKATINYYECDEGFINYWNDIVRPLSNSDICSLNKDSYLLIKEKYDNLPAKDRRIVDDYKDKAGQKIYDSMVYLSKYFASDNQGSSMAKSNLPQDLTLYFIVGIAFFGMTTISIFYLLKRRGIIS